MFIATLRVSFVNFIGEFGFRVFMDVLVVAKGGVLGRCPASTPRMSNYKTSTVRYAFKAYIMYYLASSKIPGAHWDVSE